MVALGRAYRSGSWQVQETEQFQICVQADEARAADIARACEQILSETCAAWFDDVKPVSWRPRCQVIIHPNKTSYLAAVGPAGGSTVGSALVERRDGRVVSRRIDLCTATRGGALSALPHEMTHVVLSDHFAAADPPRWADEGIAVLADPRDKRDRHAGELARAIRTRTLFRLPELMSDVDNASATRADVFYAQSTSLVEFLIARGTRGQFLEFLTRAANDGYDAALRELYAIDGVAALEKLWHREVTSREAAPTIDSLVEDDVETTSSAKRS